MKRVEKIKGCVFCDFISGNKKENINGLPFKPLEETCHSISFLAIDIPKKTKINVLVIPKKHYTFVEDVPDKIMLDLMKHSQKIIKALKKEYPGVNMILNDGWYANQRVPHVHFHLYPRKKGDKFYNGFKPLFKRNHNLKEFEKTFGEVEKLLKNI